MGELTVHWSCWYHDEGSGKDLHYGISTKECALEWLRKEAEKGRDVWVFDPARNKHLPDGRTLTPEEQRIEAAVPPVYEGFGTYIRKVPIAGTVDVEALQYGSLDGTMTQVIPRWVTQLHLHRRVFEEGGVTYFQDVVGATVEVKPSDWLLHVNNEAFIMQDVIFRKIYHLKFRATASALRIDGNSPRGVGGWSIPCRLVLGPDGTALDFGSEADRNLWWDNLQGSHGWTQHCTNAAEKVGTRTIKFHTSKLKIHYTWGMCCI